MINISVQGASLAQRDDGTVVLALTLQTTNTDYPGERLTFAVRYDGSMTAQEIQSAVNDAVTLLWMAHGMPSWTV